MLAYKKYFLSEQEREKYEEPLIQANPRQAENIYQLDDEQLLEMYKKYIAGEKDVALK
ncbi:hypothetical protein [Bacillus sp. FJAT-47783]|uniref:hypothetical protein n=1 Tax=Bacillus sp. FJAT-47783 TaxID=2922712 RepID=UPI001FAB6D8F|nr:hypothetical protein [Bacillus sp. FJAT-47783]